MDVPKGGVTLKGKKKNVVPYKGGSTQSTIIALGLDGVVQELRLKKGWGGIRIANYINGNAAKYLPDDGTIVTVPTINRYLKSAGLVEQKKDNAKEAINVYSEVTDEEFGSSGCWKSVTFGNAIFISKCLKEC